MNGRASWTGATCRTCRAKIIWTLSVTSNRRLPVDVDPVPTGNIVLTSGNDGPESRVLKVAELEARRRRHPAELLYLSHHASCPDGRDWQRGR